MPKSVTKRDFYLIEVLTNKENPFLLSVISLNSVKDFLYQKVKISHHKIYQIKQPEIFPLSADQTWQSSISKEEEKGDKNNILTLQTLNFIDCVGNLDDSFMFQTVLHPV